jgi:hypothetical protein
MIQNNCHRSPPLPKIPNSNHHQLALRLAQPFRAVFGHNHVLLDANVAIPRQHRISVIVEFGATGHEHRPAAITECAVPLTGRKVEFNVCEIHEWNNSKLTRLVNYQHAMSLMAQLGLLPQRTGL